MIRIPKIRKWTKEIYYCHDCGVNWKTYDRYYLWPIKIKLVKRDNWNRDFFGGTAWEVAPGKMPGERRFSQCFRAGRIFIWFGPSVSNSDWKVRKLQRAALPHSQHRMGVKWLGKPEDED